MMVPRSSGWIEKATWRGRTIQGMCRETCRRARPAAILLALLLGLTTVFLPGCRRPQSQQTGPSQDTAGQTATLHRDELFEIAVTNLNRLYQFDGMEMVYQVADRLDQWVKTQPPLSDWTPDPLLKTLPPELAKIKALQNLPELKFTRDDGLFLQTAVWLRDIAAWARGDDPDELSRAVHLFDWVMLHVQLDPQELVPMLPSRESFIQKPWETLLFGHGSVLDRAWLFVLLCRQEGLDAAILAVEHESDGNPAQLNLWAVGVLVGGKIYVFEPSLGFPIPRRDGVKIEKDQGLVISPASLDELVADDTLLRRLDADARNPYPVTAAQLKKLTVFVEGSPPYLSRRMEMVQRMLSGEESLVVSFHPSDQAGRFRAVPQMGDVSLWSLPYVADRQREEFGPQIEQYLLRDLAPLLIPVESVMPLWRARVLTFRGELFGEEGAAHYYQLARPPERILDSGQFSPEQQAIYTMAKVNAAYWLGLLAVQQGNRKSAEDYLIKRTALAQPVHSWRSGVLYALGRLNERLGDYPRAITAYRSEMSLPNRYGNLVRARWIEELTGAKPLEAEETAPQEKSQTEPAKPDDK